jgi:hypothetical protein
MITSAEPRKARSALISAVPGRPRNVIKKFDGGAHRVGRFGAVGLDRLTDPLTYIRAERGAVAVAERDFSRCDAR